MKFGYFDDERKEYVIDTPYTPLPWINYLGNDNFFSIISNTAGGYSFYRDAKLRRITRYRYNSPGTDNGGRYFYITDKKTVFSPAFLPSKTPLDFYRCRHGLNYTVFESKMNDFSAELLCFVPQEDNCEIDLLKIKNDSAEEKTRSPYTAVWNSACGTHRTTRRIFSAITTQAKRKSRKAAITARCIIKRNTAKGAITMRFSL